MGLFVTVPVALLAGLGVGIVLFAGVSPVERMQALSVRRAEARTDVPVLPKTATATDAKAQRVVAAALRKGQSIERDNEMYLAIEALTAEDFQRLLTDAGALKAMAEKLQGIDWQAGRNLASGLIRRWLAVDLKTVMTWAPRVLDLIPAKENARGWILDALAENRPQEMLALVASRKDPAERKEIISRALRELAVRDLRAAQAWVHGCTDPTERREAEKAIHFGIVKSDPVRAIELAQSIENRQDGYQLLRAAAESAAKTGEGMLRQLATTPMKPWMLSPVLQQLADRDPELAVDLAIHSAIDGSDRTFGIQSAFTALTRRDPVASIAKVEGLTGRELAAAVSVIGRTWAAQEPAKALEWLASRSAAERVDPNVSGKDVLTVTFSSWASDSPSDARAWADALPEGATRDAVQSALAGSLAANGELVQAAQVLARLGGAADPKAVAGVAGIWARRDPQAAAEWALSQEAGSAQSRALAGIVGTWADEDPERVGNWLAQFPPGEARDRSIGAFLWRSTASTGGIDEWMQEFDRWFDLIDDPWRRARVALSSFWQRKRRDPAGARAWLSSLTNVDPELIRVTLRDNSD